MEFHGFSSELDEIKNELIRITSPAKADVLVLNRKKLQRKVTYLSLQLSHRLYNHFSVLTVTQTPDNYFSALTAIWLIAVSSASIDALMISTSRPAPQ